MRLYLADLGHDQVTVSSDVFPLGVANLATYVQADDGVAGPVEIQIFRAPSAFKAAVDAEMPDLVGFSNYAWNHRLTRHFARYVKERDDDVLVAMGGPNYPLTREEQEEFVRSMPEIDVHVRGPTYEGERAFRNLVRRFADAGRSREGIFEEAIPGSAWSDPKTGDFVVGEDVPKLESLDEIPSPYRRGLMDQFFGSGLFPLLQITRGCPFTCAFCNSAVRSNTVRRHSVEEVQADLRYVAERVDPEIPLCFADDNFGMYPWDEEISDFIAQLQEEYGWPRYIRTTTGKNRGDRIVKVMRKLRGVLPMTSAVQSLNPTVLENIERDNIDLDTYAQIQEEVQAQGMQAYGELILCLPGETKESFMTAIRDLLASGVKRVAAHQLMLLHGAPLSNPDVRAEYGFVTRHRVVARNLGDYTGEPVIETEEVVVATPHISFDEYLEIRVFHLLLTIFHYEGNFEEMFAFAREHGVEAFDLVVALQDEMDRAPRAFRAVIDRFLEESELELFESESECVAWAKENFEDLRAGRVGGNLLQNYSMEGRFFVTLEALEFLETAVRTVLGDTLRTDVDRELSCVSKYLRGVLLHAPFEESLEEAPSWETCFDVEAWREDGFERSLSGYRLEEPVHYQARLPEDRKAVLEQRLETFGESPTGLGKFTRTMFATDLRREVTLEASEPVGVGTTGESAA
ncbi:MAG: radical SAM protein [Halobacteriales archaeon]|nr:radical SAM protein [Halobacteriales archaeon]